MAETFIDTEQSLLTVIVVVMVDPGRQDAFLERLEMMIGTFTRHQPGFVSSAVHGSEDGGMVINYSQWRDRDSFCAFRDHPEGERHIAELQDICQSMDARIMPPRFIYTSEG